MGAAKLAIRIPARKTPAAGDTNTQTVIQRQVGDRALIIPVGAILIARLAKAVREIIFDLRLAPNGAACRAVDARLRVNHRHAAVSKRIAIRPEIQPELWIRIGTRFAALQQRFSAHRVV